MKNALESLNIRTFLCDVAPGEDILHEIAEAFDEAILVVILGTRTYGMKTSARYSTFEEMMFVHNENKPIFLVRMCDHFDSATTRFILTDSLRHVLWTPGTPMPNNLIDSIVNRLNGIPNPAHHPAGGVYQNYSKLAFLRIDV